MGGVETRAAFHTVIGPLRKGYARGAAVGAVRAAAGAAACHGSSRRPRTTGARAHLELALPLPLVLALNARGLNGLLGGRLSREIFRTAGTVISSVVRPT